MQKSSPWTETFNKENVQKPVEEAEETGKETVAISAGEYSKNIQMLPGVTRYRAEEAFVHLKSSVQKITIFLNHISTNPYDSTEESSLVIFEALQHGVFFSYNITEDNGSYPCAENFVLTFCIWLVQVLFLFYTLYLCNKNASIHNGFDMLQPARIF